MATLPAETPDFFHRGPSPATRLVFVGLLSILLLFLDTRYRYLEQLREVVAVVLHPVQRAAALPGEAIAEVAGYFASKRELERENEALRARLAEIGVVAQGAGTTRAENERLRALLDLRSRHGGEAHAVQVLYKGRDPFSQKLVVDKGRDDGIAAGTAVVDADGVVGQVTRVYPHMAEVTLVTDKDHVIPVTIERSGSRAVMTGSGAGRAPELRFIPPTADVRVGDLLVTSGLDGTYPPGLAVAKVAAVDRDTGQIFAQIALQPLAGVDRSNQLLVLGPVAELPPRPEEPQPADADRKGGKAKARRGG